LSSIFSCGLFSKKASWEKKMAMISEGCRKVVLRNVCWERQLNQIELGIWSFLEVY
jgi:hypothetical protein